MKRQLLTIAATAGIAFTAFIPQASASTYTVQSGDTLWKIASTQNLSVNQIIEWNNLSNSVIFPGQTLKMSDGQTASVYTVKSGDTLWSIASKHGTTVAAIKSLNSLTSDAIQAGQTLKVSGQAAPVSVSQPVSSYVVQSGDTLWSIATRHQLTVDELKGLNGLTTNTIQVGQVLKVAGSVQAPPAAVNKAEAVITEARKHIGVPYVWGGSTTAGFDCSGYLNFVFAKAGIQIPRTVETIWNATKSVASPQRGDLVFFETYKAGPSHAGIYLGNNQFIHAGTSTGVTITDMNNSYWKPRYLGAKTPY